MVDADTNESQCGRATGSPAMIPNARHDVAMFGNVWAMRRGGFVYPPAMIAIAIGFDAPTMECDVACQHQLSTDCAITFRTPMR